METGEMIRRSEEHVSEFLAKIDRGERPEGEECHQLICDLTDLREKAESPEKKSGDDMALKETPPMGQEAPVENPKAPDSAHPASREDGMGLAEEDVEMTVMSLEQLYAEFDECAQETGRILETILESVRGGTVPSKAESDKADLMLEELGQRYEAIRKEAGRLIPSEELPEAGSPAREFIDAVQNSHAMVHRRALEEAADVLIHFLSVRSDIERYSAAIQPYQDKAEGLLKKVCADQIQETESLPDELQAPQTFLKAISCEDLESDEGNALLEELEPLYSRTVFVGIIKEKYYVDEEIAGQIADQTNVSEDQVPSVDDDDAEDLQPVDKSVKEEVIAEDGGEKETGKDNTVTPEGRQISENRKESDVAADSGKPVPEGQCPSLNAADGGESVAQPAVINIMRKHALISMVRRFVDAGQIDEEEFEPLPQIEQDFVFEEYCWMKEGIVNREAVIIKDDGEVPEIQVSNKANNKFGVNEFKKDMSKGIFQKLDCLMEVYRCGAITAASVSLYVGHEKPEDYQTAISKLFNSGYLQRITIEGMGEFYTLSKRAAKAFQTRGSREWIKETCSTKLDEDHKAPIEITTANQARTALMALETRERINRINEGYSFRSSVLFIQEDFFTCSFFRCIGDKAVEFFGLVTEKSFTFQCVHQIEGNKEDPRSLYIVLEPTLDIALQVARWARSFLQEEVPILCTVYSEEDYWNEFGEIVDIQELMAQLQEESDPEDEQNCEEEDPSRETTEINETGEGQDEAEAETEQIEVAVKTQEEPKAAAVSESGESSSSEGNLPQDKPEMMADALVEPAFNMGLTGDSLDRIKEDEIYQMMLADRQFYAAVTYVKALAQEDDYYAAVYRQLAYALNDPMENCNYNSETILNVFYYSADNMPSGYYAAAASLRNFFLDQYRYDHNLRNLMATISGESTVKDNTALERTLYTIQKFKEEEHVGINFYADYHEKDRDRRESDIREVRKRARELYEKDCSGHLKESTTQRRFLETEKRLLDPGSELSEFLKAVKDGEHDRDTMALLQDFLKENYIKEETPISPANIDDNGIIRVIEEAWEDAGTKVMHQMKSSKLMGRLRGNLFKKIRNIVEVLSNYVALIGLTENDSNDSGLIRYKRIRSSLIRDIEDAMNYVSAQEDADLPEKAGISVLNETLGELKARLEGNYTEGESRYFYIDFLRNDKVLLDNDFCPMLDEVPELPEFSLRSRIISSCEAEKKDWGERLCELRSGGDDFGSAMLIVRYLEERHISLEGVDISLIDLERDAIQSGKTALIRKKSFIENLELAQSYGQLVSGSDNSKEAMIQIMESWYQWAEETWNYGFFYKILNAFLDKIQKDAVQRGLELEENLNHYLVGHPDWMDSENVRNTVAKVRSGIARQNYAAAEDMLNRLSNDDLGDMVELHQTDHLDRFLQEYLENCRRTSNIRMPLSSLIPVNAHNKDSRGAERLLNNWPKSGREEERIRNYLTALGFRVNSVTAEEINFGKTESYLITIKRPKDGRRSNYRHPIAAFGSEAEARGFRIICLYGKYDAERLIDTFKEVGNAKNTIVLLDWALTLPDRRALARKSKTDMNGNRIFAVIDRVVMAYLIKYYNETAVNRMLMEIVMPFASYQPYIDKSADVMPPEMFIGRRHELEAIENPMGVNIVYGGRQLGKTAMLRMAKKNLDHDEEGNRAIIVDVNGMDYRKAAKAVSAALYDENILFRENITDDWDELARDIKNRLRDSREEIPYLLLMMDEADAFIESCESIEYQPFNALKDIQSIGTGRFKFVIAGLRNIVRFKRKAALSNNSVLAHLESLTVTPFKSTEARELLELPLYYLGFRFPDDEETEMLVSTIFGTTNYFPGLIQLYCSKLIETLRKDYAGYTEADTPPYCMREKHIKRALGDQRLQEDIRDKFFITLKVGDDDFYYIIALLVASLYHTNRSWAGCSAAEVCELADSLSITKITSLGIDQVEALMEEMNELNVLQHTGDGRYRFTRHSFCEMMGKPQQIDDELLAYMGD